MLFLFVKSQKLRVNRCTSGFTLVETLVAIAVLLLAVSAPLSLAERSLASAETARQEVTAFYLAQEAVEFVKNKRDENAITGKGGGSNWLSGLSECESPKGCGIDAATSEQGKQLVKCDDNDDCVLWRHTGDPTDLNDAQRGMFGYPKNRKGGNTEHWLKTTFQRRVFVSELEDDKEARITAEVNWTAGALGSRTLSVRSVMTNWYAP